MREKTPNVLFGSAFGILEWSGVASQSFEEFEQTLNQR